MSRAAEAGARSSGKRKAREEGLGGRGRATEKVAARGHDKLSTFALLADCPIPELRGYLEQLLDGGFLRLEGDRYPLVKVTPEGRRLLKAETSCRLFRHRRPEKRAERRSQAATESWQGVDRELFEALRKLRLEIAREREVPPYVIFHDSTLRHLARLRPADRAALLAVPGVGQRKADDLGERFLAAIARFGATADPTIQDRTNQDRVER